jgi:hypothetical protein
MGRDDDAPTGMSIQWHFAKPIADSQSSRLSGSIEFLSITGAIVFVQPDEVAALRYVVVIHAKPSRQGFARLSPVHLGSR